MSDHNLGTPWPIFLHFLLEILSYFDYAIKVYLHSNFQTMFNDKV